MPLIAVHLGGPGTGKTRALLETMAQAIDAGNLAPELIGYCSFTRAACDEAADRAADQFGVARAELRDKGWFKTVHGVVYRCLGIGKELLTEAAESKRWLQEALQDDVEATGEEMDEDHADVFEGRTSDAQRALALWNACRNRLLPLRPVWEEAEQCDDRTPTYDDCRATVERYEQAKRLDGRKDFTDILGTFAGYRFRLDEVRRVDPQGEPPELPVWFHDEMQDSSALLDACFRRLIEQEGVRWVYLGMDPFQSIYHFSGADHRFGLAYRDRASKVRTMPRSYRCLAEILALGESILSDCTDYWDRHIEPAGPGGEIDHEQFGGDWAEDVSPRESWLLLARTNYQATRLAKRLDGLGIPWLPTKKTTGCKWKAPVRNMAICALLSLQAGAPISGVEWQAAVDRLPAKLEGEPLLIRGAKTYWNEMAKHDAEERYGFEFLNDLPDMGATPRLVELIANGRWREVVEGASTYCEAVERWGQDAVSSPGVRVGTVHSAKGGEADNVALLTTLSEPCIRSTETEDGMDENLRTKYVAVTRARKRLVVLSEATRFRWKVG